MTDHTFLQQAIEDMQVEESDVAEWELTRIYNDAQSGTSEEIFLMGEYQSSFCANL